MILVVDDHADTRKILIRLLKLEGYEATEAESGRQALELMETLKPRLLLLDYGMPEMSGLQVFLEMRRTPVLATIPVVMFSAFCGQHRQEALKAGVNAYVVKGSLDWPHLLREILELAGPPDARGRDVCHSNR